MKNRFILGTVVILAGAVAPVLAGWWHPAVDFNFGPSDHNYLEGFEPMWEIDPDGVATHWSTYEATIRLPVTPKAGKATISYRFARVYRETAQIEIRVNGVPADRFSASGGAYQIRSVEIPSSVLEKKPLMIHLTADSHERKNRGLRMDWLRVEPTGSRGRAAPVPGTVLLSAGLCLAVAAIIAITLGRTMGAAFLAPIGLVLYGALAGPLPLAHMLRWVAPSGMIVSVILIAIHRLLSRKLEVPGLEWLPLLFLTAFLLRAGGVFHPRFFHPDLRAHADMTRIVGNAGLDFWSHPSRYIEEQGVWTAESMGKMYAFPFSPVFHALFVPLSLGLIGTMEAMKLLACLLSSFEVLIIFYLARRLGLNGAAPWAAALVVVSPPVLSRLSLAFMAALFAHFLDTVVLASLASLPVRRRLALACALGFLLLALGSYAGSLINFGLFIPLFGLALITRKELRKTGLLLIGGAAGVAALSLLLVYREFLSVFLSEILPRFLAGEAKRGEGSFSATLGMLFHRTWIFYGFWILPSLFGGAVLWLRKRSAFPSRFLVAWALTYVLLIVLRTAAPDLFAKVKEMLWVAPLVALAAGETLAWLQRSFPVRWPAVVGYGVLAIYGVVFYTQAIASTFELAR
jgi:hypothetical protein